ncbi:MAG: cell division protein CrgA [Candidatus Riflebacteria bacterium]|nr:cell division protein CrgA [Candidatus Riflebacteria bacterium]
MDEQDFEQPQPELPRKTKRALRKEAEREADERPRPSLPDPEGAHKKFVAIMVGLFLLALILMIVFNEFMDFSVDGGI